MVDVDMGSVIPLGGSPSARARGDDGNSRS
jgi:hypothetical protein